MLFRSETRDQSYFLFATTRDQLDVLRFPLGDMPKSEVRALAAEYGLVTAGKPDSQDICFVPQGRYTDVVRKLRPDASQPGEVVDLDGHVLGTHQGILHFTVGQRKGLNLSGNAEPLFVVRLDAAERKVVVGPREALRTRTINVADVNWLVPAPEGVPLACHAKVRSMRPPVAASVTPLPGRQAHVELAGGEDAVAPGQACVFYSEVGGRVLGGGWIRKGPTNSAAAA